MNEIIGYLALCALASAALIHIVGLLADKAADQERHWK